MSENFSRFVKIRDFVLADEYFVYSSWLKNFWLCAKNDGIRKNIFFEGHHKVIEKTLKKSSCLIAAHADDHDQIIGWICTEDKNILHYIYVKSPFRRSGIAELLIAESDLVDTVIVTHETEMLKHLKLRSEYNPYLR